MLIADTHAWIWWLDKPTLLSRRSREAFENEDEIGVNTISCWELAMLVARRRLTLDREPLLWLKQSMAEEKILTVELTPEIAALSATLDELPGDPADRIIVASALHYDVPLVTKDRRLRSFKKVKTIW